jgi:hypothetical protein
MSDYNTIGGLLTSGDVRNDFLEHIGKLKKENTFHKFSFKNYSQKTAQDNIQIFPFPYSLESFLEDINLKYNDNYVDYFGFLNSIPQAQIRAYVPDTALQLMSDMFSTLVEAVQYGWNKMDISDDAKKLLEGGKRVVKTLTDIFTNNLGAGEVFYTKLKSDLVGSMTATSTTISEETGLNGQTAIIDFPYIMYYKIMGATTNAVYEIPTEFPSNFLNSNGNFGWNTNNKNATNIFGSGVENSLFNFILNKLNFSMAPIFNPSGAEGELDGVEFKFDLINDTINSAKNNMKFIHVLTGNNKWIQQGLFSSSANLYDVKIAGGQRLFMTKGIFTIAFKGAVRTLKNSEGFYFGEHTRVPEAYSVTMKFESVLPGNFNSYMLGLIKGNEDLFAYKKREDGVAGKIVDAFSSAMDAAEKEVKKTEEAIKNNKSLLNEDVATKVTDYINSVDTIGLMSSEEIQKIKDEATTNASKIFDDKINEFRKNNPGTNIDSETLTKFKEEAVNSSIEKSDIKLMENVDIFKQVAEDKKAADAAAIGGFSTKGG